LGFPACTALRTPLSSRPPDSFSTESILGANVKMSDSNLESSLSDSGEIVMSETEDNREGTIERIEAMLKEAAGLRAELEDVGVAAFKLNGATESHAEKIDTMTKEVDDLVAELTDGGHGSAPSLQSSRSSLFRVDSSSDVKMIVAGGESVEEERIEALTREVAGLKAELEEARCDGAKAAAAGNELLSQLSEVRSAMDAALQDAHHLKLQLKAQSQLSENLQDELDKAKVDLSEVDEKKAKDLEALNKKVSEAQERINENQLLHSQEMESLQKAITERDNRISSLKVELRTVQTKLARVEEESKTVDDADEQIEILVEKAREATEAKEKLEQSQEVLLRENTELLEKINALKGELCDAKLALEEAEAEVVGYQASMGQVKTEMEQMRSKLCSSDVIGMENQRGNSLFSEVDDRRKIVEEKLKKAVEKCETFEAESKKKAKQLARAQRQNAALINKAAAADAATAGAGENSSASGGVTAKHLEELLMRERAKNTTLMQQLSSTGSSSSGSILTSGPGNEDFRLREQIRQTVLAEDMLMEANKTIARLEKSERSLKAENSNMKFELENLKENRAIEREDDDFTSKKPLTSVPINKPVPKTETLTFKKAPPTSVKSKRPLDDDIADLLIGAKVAKSSFVKEKPAKKDEKETEEIAVFGGKKKSARFADSVTTHEYQESDAEKKAKSRVISKGAVDAQAETEKIQNECKQS